MVAPLDRASPLVAAVYGGIEGHHLLATGLRRNPVYAGRLLPSKSARRHASRFAESPAEMTLTREPEGSRDLNKQSPLQEQILCPSHALVDNILVRRLPKSVRK